jgi:hypothetical protein
MTIRQRFFQAAASKAWKAYRRHGEGSVQFIEARASRWLRRRPTMQVANAGAVKHGSFLTLAANAAVAEYLR